MNSGVFFFTSAHSRVFYVTLSFVMRIHPRYVFPGAFAIAGALAIAAVLSPWQAMSDGRYIRVWGYAMLALFVVGIAYAMIRRRALRDAWNELCAIAAVLGVWLLPAVVFPVWAAILASSAGTLVAVFIRALRPAVMLIGSIGVALAFAQWMPIEVLLIGLAGLTLYDMVFGQTQPVDRVGAWLIGPLAVMLGMLPFGWTAVVGVLGGGCVGAVFGSMRSTAREGKWLELGVVCSAVLFLVYYAVV
jgi:hypothetical protein